MRKKVEARSRQANYQLIQKAEGMCPRCGTEKLDFNQAKGKPFALGPACRKAKAETQKALMARRRNSGLVDWAGRLTAETRRRREGQDCKIND